MSIVLKDSAFRELRDFIYERCGIYISDAKKYLLESRLAKRVGHNNLSSFEDYLYLLKYNSNSNELVSLYDAITTNETFFFREPQHYDILIDSVLPGVMKQNGSRGIRIWSAACSTGEEPYTLMMLFREKITGVNVDMFASDISNGVLESAKTAVYSSYSVRNVPEPFLRKYFKPAGQLYELDQTIKKSVKFMNINLVDNMKTKTVRDADVIFCRNVLIYFDEKAKQKVVSHLYDSLKPGGYLFIGASESLHNVTRAFKPMIINKVVVYQKT